jgi:hypothetical protein
MSRPTPNRGQAQPAKRHFRGHAPHAPHLPTLGPRPLPFGLAAVASGGLDTRNIPWRKSGVRSRRDLEHGSEQNDVKRRAAPGGAGRKLLHAMSRTCFRALVAPRHGDGETGCKACIRTAAPGSPEGGTGAPVRRSADGCRDKIHPIRSPPTPTPRLAPSHGRLSGMPCIPGHAGMRRIRPKGMS